MQLSGTHARRWENKVSRGCHGHYGRLTSILSAVSGEPSTQGEDNNSSGSEIGILFLSYCNVVLPILPIHTTVQSEINTIHATRFP